MLLRGKRFVNRFCLYRDVLHFININLKLKNLEYSNKFVISLEFFYFIARKSSNDVCFNCVIVIVL